MHDLPLQKVFKVFYLTEYCNFKLYSTIVGPREGMSLTATRTVQGLYYKQASTCTHDSVKITILKVTVPVWHFARERLIPLLLRGFHM